MTRQFLLVIEARLPEGMDPKRSHRGASFLDVIRLTLTLTARVIIVADKERGCEQVCRISSNGAQEWKSSKLQGSEAIKWAEQSGSSR